MEGGKGESCQGAMQALADACGSAYPTCYKACDSGLYRIPYVRIENGHGPVHHTVPKEMSEVLEPSRSELLAEGRASSSTNANSGWTICRNCLSSLLD
jgi:hypothetical protein